MRWVLHRRGPTATQHAPLPSSKGDDHAAAVQAVNGALWVDRFAYDTLACALQGSPASWRSSVCKADGGTGSEGACTRVGARCHWVVAVAGAGAGGGAAGVLVVGPGLQPRRITGGTEGAQAWRAHPRTWHHQRRPCIADFSLQGGRDDVPDDHTSYADPGP